MHAAAWELHTPKTIRTATVRLAWPGERGVANFCDTRTGVGDVYPYKPNSAVMTTELLKLYVTYPRGFGYVCGAQYFVT